MLVYASYVVNVSISLAQKPEQQSISTTFDKASINKRRKLEFDKVKDTPLRFDT